MIRLKESIHVNRPLEDVFRYTSDFSNIQEWDPGVISSVATQPGKADVGSAYDLVLKFGPSRPKMKYIITEYEPFSKVVLKGEGQSYSVVDIISFRQTETGTQVDYQADIQFRKLGSLLDVALSFVMKRIGKKAMSGLKQKFDGVNNRKGWFKSGSGLFDFFADHAILPGMLLFSRYGYALSKIFWKQSTGNLSGKRVILTGGTSGIGKAAAFMLAEKDALLTIIARNPQKAAQVQKEIIQKTNNPNVDYLIADLSLMKDVQHVAEQIQEKYQSIDVLINNAGALFNERRKTAEGIEQTFAIDLLGVFYLTTLLKDVLAQSIGARVINVSSGGMYTQKIDVNDLENSFEPFDGAKAYARAKRGMVILTQIWSDHFRAQGITVNAMHPGWVDTPGIERSLPKFHQLVNRILRTPEQGADTIVWLAASKKAGQHTGLFWLDRRPRETVIFPGTGGTAKERQVLLEKLNHILNN